MAEFWYYSAEIAPGVIKRGQYADTLPMLPRMLLRNIDCKGATCLDVGAMEGLMSVLMRKRGAAHVLATDTDPHCAQKMQALKAAHGVTFDFERQPLAYGLAAQLRGRAFDLINLSGLLYHVISPLMVLVGVRPLLKPGALIIVSTNVLTERGMHAEFNARGALQAETNTFWYPTSELLEYWLHMMRLQPLDAAFLPHAACGAGYQFARETGYLSVVCRAIDAQPQPDAWMAATPAQSVEFQRLTAPLADLTVSEISYAASRRYTMAMPRIVRKAETHHDSHFLMLGDTE